jgi:PTS system fructose-specific IIC component
MLGGAITGAMTMGFHVTSQAPHGGIFVFFAIGNVLMFILSIVVGTIVAGLAVVALKRWAVRKPVDSVGATQLVSQGR